MGRLSGGRRKLLLMPLLGRHGTLDQSDEVSHLVAACSARTGRRPMLSRVTRPTLFCRRLLVDAGSCEAVLATVGDREAAASGIHRPTPVEPMRGCRAVAFGAAEAAGQDRVHHGVASACGDRSRPRNIGRPGAAQSR